MSRLALGPEEAHPLVDGLLGSLPGPPVARAIHADDEMLAVAVEREDGDLDRGLASYFCDGWRVATSMQQIAMALGGFDRLGAVLDFASGYGRATRFLARRLDPARLWVAEIDPQAVEFQGATFGVHALQSAADPAAFVCPQTFDLIYAVSLFTHLPSQAFHTWLRRLSELLRPAGLLALTVHDFCLLPPGHPRPPDGFVFEPTSESGTLAPQSYGSTWVSEGFLRRAAAEAAPGLAVRRIALGLGGYQDVYLLARRSQAELDALPYDPGPHGFLERAGVESGRLRLSGWATGWPGGSRLAAVRAWLDGRLAAETPGGVDRPDLAALHGEAARRSGFALALELPRRPRHGSSVLSVKAASESGVEALLHFGTVETALLRSARGEAVAAVHERFRREEAEHEARHLAVRVEELEARIAAMRRSRFWRIRDAWFAVKRALGWTREM
ncbi:MAG TPA: class I SAM-dependent methyltransferase [Thermoanaerobaculia bacterium]|nr:class I SAM-dependent methyltransferase [Thermoanaerobaculia bacterium]